MKPKSIVIIFIILIVIAIVIAFSSCKPSGMTDETYILGLKALRIADDCIDANITSYDACNKLERILELLAIGSSNKIDKDIISVVFHRVNLISFEIEKNISILRIVRERNNLAKELNVASRDDFQINEKE